MVEASELELSEILEEVRRIDLQMRRLVTDVMAGSYVSVFRGSGLEFDGVREYAEGDPQHAVDWNVTARMGRPYVKKYVEEREQTLLFVLDLSASMGGGYGIWSARQTAARVCACLALLAARNNDKVGLIAFSADVDAYVAPRKGLGHALRIVRDCLVLPGSSAETALGPALQLAERAIRRHAIVFVISDFLADGWQSGMARCARRHDVIAVRLLTPELAPPEGGLTRIRDPETGRVSAVDWARRRVREGYAARVAAWKERIERELTRLRVDRMDVPVPREPGRDLLARPILDFFRMRQLRGAKR